MTVNPLHGTGRIQHALDNEPALTLLAAYHRDWIIPLFAEIEAEGGHVATENLHLRIEGALAEHQPDNDTKITPSERCRRWVETNHWLDIQIIDGTYHYLLTPHTRRALEFIRSLTDDTNTATGARFKSIAYAVHELATMVNPDRHQQALDIKRQIADLTRKHNDIIKGRTPLASLDESRGQLREVLSLTNSLPADFDSLRKAVEDSHHAVTRRAFTDAPTKADLVDDYLRENDLLASTPEGRNYRQFSQMLSSDEATQVQKDIDDILGQEFAARHMTAVERDKLDSMMSTLLGFEHRVRQAHMRWTSSLRRFLTRQAPGRRQQLVEAADQALAAGTAWVVRDPGGQRMIPNVLGVGALDLPESADLRLWRRSEDQQVEIEAVQAAEELTAEHWAAMRLAAGTSVKAVADTINSLLAGNGEVTGRDVYDHTDAEFRRLGLAVSLMSLAVNQGEVDRTSTEQLDVDDDNKRMTIPHVTFHKSVTVKERRNQ